MQLLNQHKSRVSDQIYITDEISFSVVLAGDSGVGKSCFLRQFITKKFEYLRDCFGQVDSEKIKIQIKNEMITVNIFGMPGSISWRSIICSFFKGSIGVLLMYDITNRKTFNNCSCWLKDIRKYDTNIFVILIGNKSDDNKARVISFKEGKKFAIVNKLLFMEASSKQYKTVKMAFVVLLEHILEELTNRNVDFDTLHGIKGITESKIRNNKLIYGYIHSFELSNRKHGHVKTKFAIVPIGVIDIILSFFPIFWKIAAK